MKVAGSWSWNLAGAVTAVIRSLGWWRVVNVVLEAKIQYLGLPGKNNGCLSPDYAEARY